MWGDRRVILYILELFVCRWEGGELGRWERWESSELGSWVRWEGSELGRLENLRWQGWREVTWQVWRFLILFKGGERRVRP